MKFHLMIIFLKRIYKMNPKMLANEEDRANVAQVLSVFYSERADAYGVGINQEKWDML